MQDINYQALQHSLNKTCKEVLLSDPFYGLLLLNLNKSFSDKIKTAGVGIEGINVVLLINPSFWQGLSENHKYGLLLHELKHCAFFHITDYNHLENKEVANVAMDIYINQFIDRKYLPTGGCFIESYYHLGLKEGGSTNEYYKLLMANKKEKDDINNTPKGSPMPNGSDKPEHQWEDISNTEARLVDAQIQKILGDTIEQVKKTSGKIPSEIENILLGKKVVEPPKFNWKKYLRTFVGNSVKNYTVKTRRKESQRFPEMPGIKVKEFSHILVGVDTSASVSDKEIKELFNEVFHMYKTGHDFTIQFFDTKLCGQVKYNPKKEITIQGRGGTDFDPIVKYFEENKKKYSCLFVLTDGEAYAPETKLKNILWVHTSVSNINTTLPGKKIKLEL
jgi:predicted metal-dependent peptidase